MLARNDEWPNSGFSRDELVMYNVSNVGTYTWLWYTQWQMCCMAPKLFKLQMRSNFIVAYHHSLYNRPILLIKSDLSNHSGISGLLQKHTEISVF